MEPANDRTMEPASASLAVASEKVASEATFVRQVPASTPAPLSPRYIVSTSPSSECAWERPRTHSPMLLRWVCPYSRGGIVVNAQFRRVVRTVLCCRALPCATCASAMDLPGPIASNPNLLTGTWRCIAKPVDDRGVGATSRGDSLVSPSRKPLAFCIEL
jgi:hypothetical protein